MLRPTQSEPLWIFWKVRTWKSWIGHEVHRTLLGPDSGLYLWHGYSSNYVSKNCVWLCSKRGLPWSLLGLGPWYEIYWVECVLSSLRIIFTPTIKQAPMMPLIPSIDLQSFEITNVSYFGYNHHLLIRITEAPPWHHCTLAASARKVLTLALPFKN